MKQKWLLVDCDGVLLDFAGGFRDFLKKEYSHFHGDESTFRKHASEFTLYKWMGLPSEKAVWDLVTEFEQSKSYRHLNAYADAQKILPRLHQEGWSIAVISHNSTEDMQRALSIKQETLERYFGNIFETVHCLPTSTNKGVVLAKYPPSFWVEDYRDNALMGANFGHQPVLLQRYKSGNEITFEPIKNGKKLMVVSSWTGVEKSIKTHRVPQDGHYRPGQGRILTNQEVKV